MVENVKYPYRRFLIFSAVCPAVPPALLASFSYYCHGCTTVLVCVLYYLYQYTNTVRFPCAKNTTFSIFHTIQYIIYLHYNILYIVIFLLPLLSIRYMLCIYPLFTYLYYCMYIYIILSILYVIYSIIFFQRSTVYSANTFICYPLCTIFYLFHCIYGIYQVTFVALY